MTNLYGDEYNDAPNRKKNSTDYDRKKRRWENGFQKWSDKMAQDGYTHYGACGYGAICNYCGDNSYGRPCVRALNELCREKRLKIDYDDPNYAFYFDGGKET